VGLNSGDFIKELSKELDIKKAEHESALRLGLPLVEASARLQQLRKGLAFSSSSTGAKTFTGLSPEAKEELLQRIQERVLVARCVNPLIKLYEQSIKEALEAKSNIALWPSKEQY